ncbi:HD domain-containing protein [Alkalicoccus luteus]|uniref:HD domain-containing protein n=1 Tax=Alkalicoccus luteus TaxID=1237094 RepID=A0A969PRN4_9BACI|nr:HD domain-containing protein [Alkalicoccus luteus]NJP39147.1 HD domain-containing protein [Alkalicoccus luteus]
MSRVTLLDLFSHSDVQKYVKRSGLAHAVACAYHAYRLAPEYKTDVELAVKAAFLHDIGHYTWYRDGEWDYELYRRNDIHAIKGAERAHRILIELGEDPADAKRISLAVLLHTDSFLPEQSIRREPLQEVVAAADEADEEPGGLHHYRSISDYEAAYRLRQLDTLLAGPSLTEQTTAAN